MQIWDLKKAIVENSIPHFLILTGEERTLLFTYLDEIENKLNIQHMTVPTLVDAYSKISSKSLLDTSKKLVVVKEDKASLSDDKLVRSLMNSSNYVVLVLTTIDKRSITGKVYANNVVFFDKLPSDMLVKVLMSKANVKESYITWLVEICDRDYGRCLNELEKVTLFPADQHNNMFEKFARDGIIYCQIPDCIFDFSNAVMKRSVKESYSLWEDLKLRGDSPIQIFSVLYSNFRNLMIVQLSPNPTKESTGLEERQINGIKWNKGKYSDVELIDTVLLIGELDNMIKQGLITEEISMEYFLAKVL